jgi:hypothetical protein
MTKIQNSKQTAHVPINSVYEIQDAAAKQLFVLVI